MRAWYVRAAAFIACSMIATIAGLTAIVAIACLTSRPALFLTAGWVIFASGVCLAARYVLIRDRRWRVAAATLVVFSVAGGIVLLWPAPPVSMATPPDTQWMSLPSGEKLAYLARRAAGNRQGTPVIFLHGGPGVADMAGDAEYMGRLTADGHDVYLYDQLGAGLSSRLSDPTGYTLARAVADLAAFRAAIGAARVDLIGYSWGAILAAAYLAAHPDHVDQVVFVSPGSMSGPTHNLDDLLGRLRPEQRWKVLRHALAPRALMAWTLAQVNPRAAHAFAGDTEMDSRFQSVVAAVAPALYCYPPAVTDAGNPGFYANVVLNRPSAWQGIDPHATLRHLHTPALVMKGQCDYLAWSTAIDYRDTLPAARMAYVPGAGHRIYAERPDVFCDEVEAFLDGRPLPLPFVTGSHPPPGYQGPVGAAQR